MIIITSLVASLLSPLAASAAPSSDASFATALSHGPEIIAKFQNASWNEEDTLLDMLRDNDVAVRRQAVRALKPYVYQRSSTRDRVLEIFKKSSEDLSVRREAAKTLSGVSGYRDVYEELLDQAKRGTDAGLRAISYKALYWTASQRSDVRDELLDAARRESDKTVRLGAIWALFAASVDNRVQDVLKDIARRDMDEDARVESLKSLYNAMGYSDVRDLAYDLARNSSTAAPVRKAAILMHANRTNNNQRDLLQDIANRDSDSAMRSAAVLALGGPRSEEIQNYFHQIRRDARGGLAYDPIDGE
ncbi:MAG: HEAT repeat domain-containing protein [Elusimicrobia bacterium]|nr:HEAT repeat domain-containing protein [Elusimicrobiota bacterium]